MASLRRVRIRRTADASSKPGCSRDRKQPCPTRNASRSARSGFGRWHAARVVKPGDPARLVCEVCSFVFYLDPKLAFAASAWGRNCSIQARVTSRIRSMTLFASK